MAVLRAAVAGVHPRVAWWRELPLLAVGYAAYACVRDLRGRDTSAVAYRVAEQHALSLLAVEQRLGIAVEGGLQARVLPLRPVVQVAATFYSTAHFLVTAGVLALLLTVEPSAYRRMRNLLAGSTLLALGLFTVFPCAPPRLLPASYGYVDALQLVGAGAWSYDRGVLEHISDPFAAVPSLHMAWATCVVVGLWPLAGRLRHRAVARLALAGYPVLTWATVVVTGNHFLLDGAAGVAVVAGAAGLRSGVAAVRRGGRWILTHRLDQDRVSGQRASPAQQGGGGRDRHDGRAGQHDEVERQSGRGPGQQAPQGVHLVGHGSRSAASAASAGQSALEAKNSGMRSGDG